MAGEEILSSILGTGIVAMFAGAIVLLFLLLVALYVYSSLVVQTIAKKTKVKPTWLAWIPLVNMVLLLKTAKLNWKWIFAIFVGVIPVLGSYLLLAAGAYLWWKVAEARHMQGWLGILTIIPLVNLVVMGYIAWAK